MKRLILITAALAILIGIAIIAFSYRDSFLPRSDKDKDAVSESLPKPDPISGFSNSPRVPADEFIQAAWLPDWGGKPGFDSFQTHNKKFAVISPVWYEVNEDGSLKNKRPGNADAITQEARKNNVELVPAIAMFDHELFTKVLQNQENLDRHVAAIAGEVEARNYDGIDLDYESTKLSDKDKYFEFLTKLSGELHANDRQLIVTVLAQWDNNQSYQSLKETRSVQNWDEIQVHADQVRIMTYDYTSFRAVQPGPIAPTNWMKQVLDYAIKHIPREKIVLGIHLYSYEWYMPSSEYDLAKTKPSFTDPLEFQPLSDFNLPISDRSARSYTYDTVKKLTGKFGGEVIEFQGEKYYRFRKTNPQTGNMEERMLVYIDPEGVKARQQLARDYGIKGVVYWRLGGEDELLD